MPTRTELLIRKLQEIRRVDGVTVQHLEEVAAAPIGEEALETPAPRVSQAAIESWRKFELERPLDERDLFQLESIVLGNGLRPAFDIQNDGYGTLPSLWQELNDRRATMVPLIRGIGRVNLTGHPQLTFAGTAFVCGQQRLITNRHVAQIFTQGLGAGAQLSFTPGITVSADLKQEVGSSDSLPVRVLAAELILDTWDIAVLRVEPLPATIAPLPLARTSPAAIEERLAAVVGYPAFDPAEDLAQQLQIFRGTFDKKRIQPGRLKGIKPAPSFGNTVQSLAHDCSVLGGNSGSAVIDVISGKVVGIHFEGEPLVANYAVPTWAIAGDVRVVNSGVQFTD
jgi:endonuclease G